MKPALLVPTDFSEPAWVALNYAAQLAQKFDWHIQILHVYQTFSRLLVNADFQEEVSRHNTQSAQQQMAEFEKRFQQSYPELGYSAACMEGDLSGIILDLVRENDIKFIVMGTKGASGLKHVTIGSNTFELIQQSPIGVLAVPANYNGFKFQKIGLLSNFKENEIDILNEFIKRSSPAIDVALLHVRDMSNTPKTEDLVYWQDHVAKAVGINNISYHDFEMVNRLDINEPIPYAVERLLEEEQVDVLLVPYVRKSFFSRLFSKSLPKTIAHNLMVPTYFKKLES